MAKGNALMTAYVSIIPEFEGGVKAMGRELGEELKDGTKGAAKDLPKEFDEAGEKAGKRFGDKFKTGLNIASAAIVGGTVAGVTGLYKVGEQFDEVMDTIRAGTGATGADLDALFESAKNVGKTVPAEFSDIGTTVADLNTRFGLTGDVLETVTAQTLEAGRVFGEELDITAVSKGFSAFQIEGEGIVDAMDNLFVTSQATGVGMSSLAQQAADAAPAMTQLGFSFEDTVSMIGQMDKAGMNANRVMRQMRPAIAKLAKEGEAPAEAFQRVTGEIENLLAAGNEVEALNLASEVFGTTGATQFITAIQQGVINVQDLQSSLGATGDTILGVGEETMDFAEQWQMFMNRALVAVEPLASKVFGAAGDALESLAPKVESFFTWISENTGTVKAIGIGVGVIAASIVAMNVALTAYNAIAGAARVVTTIWTGAQWLLNAALSANPIGLVVLAVAALIGLVVLLIANWDTVTEAVGNFFSSAYEWMLDFGHSVNEVIAGYRETLLGWLTSIKDFFVNLWNSAGEAVGKFFSGLWEWIKNTTGAVGDFFGGIGEGISQASATFVEWVGSMLGAVGDFFSGLWSGIGDVWNKVLDGGRTVFTWLQDRISTLFEWISNTISNIGTAFTNIGRGIANFFIGIANSAVAAINWIIQGMNRISIDIPPEVPVVGGRKWGVNIPTIPNIPALATGGEVTGPTLALIGEKDPETVINRGVANKTMDAQAEAIRMLSRRGGDGGGVNVYLNVNNAQNLDEETLAEKLTAMISERVAWEQQR